MREHRRVAIGQAVPAPARRVLDMTREVQLRIRALNPANVVGHLRLVNARFPETPVTTRRPVEVGCAPMAKVTGIGGVFFKAKSDPVALAAWYQKHLGFALEDFGGAILKWPDDRAEDKGLTVWHVAKP